jgi:polyisoprenoid-binding protein YceI
MKRTKIVFLAIFAVTLFASAQSEWKLDKAHSSITFTVRHMVISEVTGSFGCRSPKHHQGWQPQHR